MSFPHDCINVPAHSSTWQICRGQNDTPDQLWCQMVGVVCTTELVVAIGAPYLVFMQYVHGVLS